MPYPLDHLSAAQLRSLATRALDQLAPSRRRGLLAALPPPPATAPPPDSDPTESGLAAIERTLDFLESNERDLVALWADDWNYDREVEEDLFAVQAEIEEALAATCGRLRDLVPSAALRRVVEELLAALDDLYSWESEFWTGITYGELHEQPAAPDMIRAWLIATEPGVSPRDLAEKVTAEWPHPRSPSTLSEAIGPLHEPLVAALTDLADRGDPAAARWLVVSETGDALERYRHLAPDLGRAWTTRAAESQRWEEVAGAADDGIEVPGAALYHALMALGRFEDAYSRLFPLAQGLDPAKVWDDAVRAGQLDALRSAARSSESRSARWIGGNEDELLLLPDRYDHDRTKAVVAYAVARATHGELSSEVGWCGLGSELRRRLATAPGAHDEARCVEVALAGYEAMIAFHVRAKKRSRYARAAAYWRAHRALAERFGLEARHRSLAGRFAADLKRLPAFRDEMRRAGNTQ